MIVVSHARIATHHRMAFIQTLCLFFFLNKKETKNQDQAIAARLSLFYRKSKEGELKLLLRF
jgi:hypothetical protein